MGEDQGKEIGRRRARRLPPLRRGGPRVSRASTRLGGPPPPSRHYTQRLEPLRVSPYMFYHGDERDQRFTVALPPIKRPVTPGADSPQLTSPAMSPQGDGEPVPEDLSLTKTKALTQLDFYESVVKLPTMELDPFDDYNDDFTAGSVHQALDDLRTRREKLKRRVFNEMIDFPYGAVLRPIQRILAQQVKNDEGSMPVIRREHFISAMKDQLGVVSETTLELFCTQVQESRSDHALHFNTIMDLFQKYVCEAPYAAETMQACFSVFDAWDLRVLSLKRVRTYRGAKPQCAPGTSGATFTMIKALLDMWAHTPGISPTVTIKAFAELFAESDALVTGFIEEIIRHILVVEFRHPRFALLPKDDASLVAPHSMPNATVQPSRKSTRDSRLSIDEGY